MRTKLRMALIGALVLLLVLGGLLYFVPRTTPIDLTLNATKFDSDGNEIGTTQLSIRGKRLDYLLQKDRLEIEVDPFDEWSGFGQVKNSSSGKKGEIFPITDKLMYITFHAVEGSEIVPCILRFTEGFDHFVLTILGSEGNSIYLASVGDDHSADKVIEHFKSFNFNPVPNHKHSTDLTLNATKFGPDGTELGTMQIPIVLNETGDYFEDGILDISIQDFEGFKGFILSEDGISGKKGVIRNYIDGIYTVSLACFYGSDLSFCKLYFTDSFDHFVIYIDTDNGRYTYLATLGDDHSADKVLDHFRSLRFDPLPPK